MSRHSPSHGVSAVALALASLCASAGAQEMLPPIDVGGTPAPLPATPTPTPIAHDNVPPGRTTSYTPNYDLPSASQKTNVPLLQTPMQVQTVTEQTILDRQSLALKDSILATVSGVNVGYENFDRFMIRGFDTFDPIYRDGLQTPWEFSREMANVESIEVVKGLSSMLYGRNEPGGLVNFITKKPLFDGPHYSIEEQTNSWGLARTVVDLTGPLDSAKTLAYRLIGSYQREDSFKDFVNNRSGFLAPSLSWRPDERFQFNVRAEFRERYFVEDSDVGFPAIGSAVANVPLTRYLEPQNISTGHPENQKRATGSYDWTYNFDNDWSLTNRLTYTYSTQLRNSDSAYAVDSATGMAQPGEYYRVRQLDELATNMDIKGKFDTGLLNHKVLLGVDYIKNEINDAGCDFYSPGSCDGGTGITSTPFNIYAPYYYSLPRVNYQPTIFNDFWRYRQNQIGVYGQDYISFLDDRVHILLGGRYDWANFGSVTSNISYADIDAHWFTTTDKAFSPNVGIVLNPYPWLSFYGSFNQGFGLANGRQGPNAPPLPPQKGTQWEGGIKAELLDKRLVATFAYFDITKSNILEAANTGGFDTPVGSAESKGVEFDLKGKITDQWSIIATYANTAALFTNANSAGGPGDTGHRLQNVPRNQGSLWLKYAAEGQFKGLSLGAGAILVGERPGDNENTFTAPGYTRIDAFAAYVLPLAKPYPKTTIRLNVNNLFDRRYYEGSDYERLAVYPGAPRSFTLSVRAEF